MMEWMRKAAPAIIFVVVLVFGGTSFVGFGFKQTMGKGGKMNIGAIGKEKISIAEFSNIYRRAEMNLRDQDMSASERRQLPLRVWEEIVSGKIGSAAIKKLKLEATDEEVLASLLDNPPSFLINNPYFADEKTGQFSIDKYRSIMSMPETYSSPEVRQIEEYTRNLIPNMKLAIILNSTNVYSPLELKEQYHRANDKVVFDYLIARPYGIDIPTEKIDDKTVSDFYSKNSDKFKTDDKAELYYIKISKAPTKKDELELTNQLSAIKTSIESKESTFEDQAYRESDDDQSAENGGKIGVFKKGDYAGFDNLFENPKVGITEPFKTGLGLHIVNIDSISGKGDSLKLTLSHILKKIVPTIETLDSLDVMSNTALKIAENESIHAAATKMNLRLDSTGLFGKGEAVPGMGEHSSLGRFVFENVKDTTIELFENEDGFYISKVKTRITNGKLPIDRVEKEIRQIIRDSLQLDSAVAIISDAAKKIDTLSFKAYRDIDTTLVFGTTLNPVSRMEFVSGVGYNNRVLAQAFSTQTTKISEAVRETNGAYIVRPQIKVTAKEPTADELKDIANDLTKKRANSLFDEWYMSQKEVLGVSENVREYYY